MNKYKYYLISYSHSKGFDNIFFSAIPALDIREAEAEITRQGAKKVVIIAINEITKWQYNI